MQTKYVFRKYVFSFNLTIFVKSFFERNPKSPSLEDVFRSSCQCGMCLCADISKQTEIEHKTSSDSRWDCFFLENPRTVILRNDITRRSYSNILACAIESYLMICTSDRRWQRRWWIACTFAREEKLSKEMETYPNISLFWFRFPNLTFYSILLHSLDNNFVVALLSLLEKSNCFINKSVRMCRFISDVQFSVKKT